MVKKKPGAFVAPVKFKQLKSVMRVEDAARLLEIVPATLHRAIKQNSVRKSYEEEAGRILARIAAGDIPKGVAIYADAVDALQDGPAAKPKGWRSVRRGKTQPDHLTADAPAAASYIIEIAQSQVEAFEMFAEAMKANYKRF